MAKKLVPPIESRRVRAQKPSHARNQIGPRRFDHQMKMIAHQTVAMNLPTGLLTDFLQRLQEQLPIFVTKENRLPSVPAIHYMINRPLHIPLAACAASPKHSQNQQNTSIVISDPFSFSPKPTKHVN